jgi:hypothetical protein
VKKLKLNVETLVVCSRVAGEARIEAADGTVHAHATRVYACQPTYFCTQACPTMDASC